VAFQYLKGAYRKDGENLFSRACLDRTRDIGFKLREGSFRLEIRKRLPRGVIDAPSLENFKVRLDRALSSLI